MSTDNSAGKPVTVDMALQCLTPSTIETLRYLADKPDNITTATLSRLPLGSRTAVRELGITTEANELTTLGHDVIAAIVKQ